MARPSSALARPERFYAAAAYAGFGGFLSSSTSSSVALVSRFQDDVALLLYGLYQQAMVGPCNVPKPRVWNPVEHSKWTSWNELGSMASTEAMRLFVKILEEEDPSWYSQVPDSIIEPVVDAEIHKPQSGATTFSVVPNGNSFLEPKTVTLENGNMVETQDKNIIIEGGLGSVDVYDQWVAPTVSGSRPRPRYEHGAALLEDKMYIFGGNHNGRYLRDIQVLDLKSLAWSKVEANAVAESPEGAALVVPCAGHSLISSENKILSVAGYTKDPFEMVTVRAFDPQTCMWSNLKTYGKPPISRGGQSVTLVGKTLVMFGGRDAKRNLLNDLHFLDLETMTWDEFDAIGMPPSPRSDHVAACYADQYLLIFGGGSHTTCFNDLHVLDLKNMEWSKPKLQGMIPAPRAGHAGIAVGENWFIVGGGDNKNGVSETLVLNMSTLSWSVVSTIQDHAPVASEGLSLVLSSYNGEDVLVSFGGYNGCYSNEVYVLKPSHKSNLQSKMMGGSASDNIIAFLSTTNVSGGVEPESEAAPEGKIREIMMDGVDLGSLNIRSEDASSQLVAAVKTEKEELEASVARQQMQNVQLQQEVSEAEMRNIELTKELQSVRGQLAAEQSRCFKLEVDVAELRQKLQTMESLQKDVELLQQQKATSEQAALSSRARQSSGGGLWGWLSGAPEKSDSR
ncbi:FERM/acyl-CoA-binding protein [Dioscorea alata]|uniref:FERM/acyl-CoA-binding protein n=1 Tax=Dioscorea alata TaxID=55571 RepID=A0ACB7U3V1_DIOAL|nr:FERM/acyl-CoA-binding protein [Dioscorea alata]